VIWGKARGFPGKTLIFAQTQSAIFERAVTSDWLR